MRLAMKTASYGLTHVVVAMTVVYALTGDLALAIGIGLIEPIVQTIVFSAHEHLWESRRARRSSPAHAAARAA